MWVSVGVPRFVYTGWDCFCDEAMTTIRFFIEAAMLAAAEASEDSCGCWIGVLDACWRLVDIADVLGVWLRLARAALRRVIGLDLAAVLTAAGGEVDMFDLLTRRCSGFWMSSISKFGLVSPSASSLISISSSSLSEKSSWTSLKINIKIKVLCLNYKWDNPFNLIILVLYSIYCQDSIDFFL